MFKTHTQNRLLVLGIPLILFILINFLGLSFKQEIDLTQNKTLSLSPSTEEYLRNLKQDVTLELIFTNSNSQVPFDHRTHYQRVVDTLERMSELSDNKLSFSLSDPREDPVALEKVKFDGLTELLFAPGKTDYFGLTGRCLTKSSQIPYFHPERADLLEYDLLLLLDQIVPRTRETVGLLSGLPVTGGAKIGGSELPPWLFVRELERSYKIINYSDELHSLATIPPDVLIVMHPTGFGEKLTGAIQAYLEQGGRLIVCLDAYNITRSLMEMDHDVEKTSSGLPTLLSRWGVRYQKQDVVADMNFATEINRGYGNELLHTVLTLPKAAMNPEHPVTQSIESLGMPFTGCFEIEPDHPWEHVENLLLSTPNSALIPRDEIHQMDRQKNQVLINRFTADSRPKTFMMELKGRIPTDAPSDEPTDEGHIILIADCDFIFDAFAGESQQISDKVSQLKPYNGNIALLNNSVDHLLERSTLSIARSRGSETFPLSGLTERKAQIVARFQNQRSALEAKLTQLKQEKDKLYTHNEDQTVDEQIALNQKIKAKEQEISNTQKEQEQLDATIEKELSTFVAKIQWLNIASIPLLILISGTLYITFRTRRTKAR